MLDMRKRRTIEIDRTESEGYFLSRGQEDGHEMKGINHYLPFEHIPFSHLTDSHPYLTIL